MSDVLELEELAFRAWPASRMEVVGGWHARASRLPNRRANSVWTCVGDQADGLRSPAARCASTDSRVGLLAERIAAAEAFYAGLDRACRFHVSPASQPAGLDAALAARGYAVEAPVRVQTATVAEAAGLHDEEGVAAVVTQSPTDDWLDLSGRRGRYADSGDAWRDLLARLEGRAGFALARVEGEPVATGLGVHEGASCGVFAMATLPAFRRRGAAQALLAALARWTASRSASRLYLLVEEENAGALALYAKAGFHDAYRYHYRTQPR